MPTVDFRSGAGAVDASIVRQPGSNENWATIRAGEGTSIDSGSTTYILDPEGTSGAWSLLRRIGVSFDTSSLPDNATITAAELRFWMSGKSNRHTSQGISLVAFTPSNPGSLQYEDFDQQGASVFASIGYSGLKTGTTSGNTNTLTLNSTGRAAINKTGITSFMMLVTGDADGTEYSPNGQPPSSFHTVYSRNYGVIGNRPTLSVTYTTPETTVTPAAVAHGRGTVTPTVTLVTVLSPSTVGRTRGTVTPSGVGNVQGNLSPTVFGRSRGVLVHTVDLDGTTPIGAAAVGRARGLVAPSVGYVPGVRPPFYTTPRAFYGRTGDTEVLVWAKLRSKGHQAVPVGDAQSVKAYVRSPAGVVVASDVPCTIVDAAEGAVAFWINGALLSQGVYTVEWVVDWGAGELTVVPTGSTSQLTVLSTVVP